MSKKIPKFKTEDEERDFWATHDSMDFINQTEEVEPIEFVRKPAKIGALRSDIALSELEQFDDVKELPFMRDFLSKYQRDGQSMLPCGLTLNEYMSLEEEQREAMWTEAYRQELDKHPESEKEANPNAIPAGQGAAAEMRRRLRQLREQRKAHR